MGWIQDKLAEWKEKREYAKNYEGQMKMQKAAEMKQISSDERELMRFQKEDRAKAISEELKRRRMKMNKKMNAWILGNPLTTPNIFKGGNIFAHNKNLFLR